MPHSDSTPIPCVLQLVSEVKPQSILDVGIGWGKYGALFRMCFESGYANLSDRKNWQIRIDGIEAFPEYVGDIQRAIYDNIIIGQAENVISSLNNYDVIFLGDVIEHLEKEAGKLLIDELLKRANKMVLVITPNGPYAQDEIEGNPFERHRSAWSCRDFLSYPYKLIFRNKKTIIAAISNNPLPTAGRKWRLGPYKRFPLSAYLSAYFSYRTRRLLRRKK